MPRILALSVLFYGAMLLLSALFSAYAGLPSLFTPPATEVRGVVSIALAITFAAVVVLGGRRLERYGWYAGMAEKLRPAVRQLLGPRAGAPERGVLAAASSMGEEALFRGAIQPGLLLLALKALPPTAAVPAAIVGASLTFALFHAPVFKELRSWTLFALVFGLVLGALAAWSGSLAASVLAHFLVNFFNLGRLLEPGPVAPPPGRC